MNEDYNRIVKVRCEVIMCRFNIIKSESCGLKYIKISPSGNTSYCRDMECPKGVNKDG